MFGIQHFEAFVLASILLNLVPGPDTFYILGRSLAQGRRVGIASALGISGGAVCHTLAAAVGLSAVLTASPIVFTAIKLIGAAYLVYLGIKIFYGASRVEQSDIQHHASMRKVFGQGLLTNALNPKVALFFICLLYTSPSPRDP